MTVRCYGRTTRNIYLEDKFNNEYEITLHELGESLTKRGDKDLIGRAHGSIPANMSVHRNPATNSGC